MKNLIFALFFLFTYQLFGQAPPNDNPCDAITLTVDASCNYITNTTLNSTASGVDNPSCSYSGFNGNDVWFQATVPASGNMLIQLISTDMYNMGIAVYTGNDCNNISLNDEILCNMAMYMSNPPYVAPINSLMGLAGQNVFIRIMQPDNYNYGAFDICTYETSGLVAADSTIYTPQQLVEDVLVTGCLEAFNVTYTGSDAAIGYYIGGNELGFNNDNGIILSTGKVTDCAGPNTETSISTDFYLSGSSLFNSFTNETTFDPIILEFDFIPSSDTLSFKYIFASDEYPEFVNDIYNDVFAFFLSGPNPTGGTYTDENIALIPGTNTPVAINSVNNGNVSSGVSTGPCENCQYYVDNYQGTAFEYDGYTTPLTATALVIPCQTYHIKLAVTDVGDGIYDAAVLIEAGSFSSGGDINASHHSSYGTNPNIVYEGCENYWIFNKVDSTLLDDSIYVDIQVSGTVDINNDISSVPSSFWILPGQMADTFYYDVNMDYITEGTEYLIVSVINGCPCNTSFSNDTIWVYDNLELNPVISPDTTICVGDSATINISVNPDLPTDFVTYSWSISGTNTSITVSPTDTTSYYVTITQTCAEDTVLSCTINPVYCGFSVDMNSDTICEGDCSNLTATIATQGLAPYSYTWSNSNLSGPGPHNLCPTTTTIYSVTVTDDSGDTASASGIIYVNPLPVASAASNSPVCDGNILSFNGGSDGLTYTWTGPNGFSNTSQNPSLTADLSMSGTYTLIVNDPNNCYDTTTTDVVINPNYSSTEDVEICYGESYTFHDGVTHTNITSNESYNSNLTSISGCDSIITTNISIIPILTSTIDTAMCEGSVFISNQGNTYSSTGTYIETYTSSLSCDSIVTINITVYPNPTPVIIGDLDICEGEHTTLSLSSLYSSYSWSDSSTTPSISINTADLYTVYVTTNFGCTGNASANVNVYPNPTPTITGILNICLGEQTTLNAGQGYSSYHWSNGTGYQIINTGNAGIYSVTVSDANSCKGIASVELNVDEVKIVASSNQIICNGENVILNATITSGISPYNYYWSTNEHTPSIIVSPHTQTSYHIYIVDSLGCVSNTETIVIDVSTEVILQTFSNRDTVCPGEAVIISNYISGGMSPYSLYNQYGDIISTNTTVYPNMTETYDFTVIDACNATSSDNITIYTYPIPPLSFSADVLEGCPPLTVHFNLNEFDNNNEYIWDFDDINENNLSLDVNPTHIFTTAGFYDISVQTTDEHGCKNQLTLENLIHIFPSPKAKFDILPDVVSIVEPTLYFDNYSENATNFVWSFDDQDSSYLYEPSHTYNNIGTYNVVLIAINEYDCRDTAEHLVKVEDICTLYAPSAFSPDGDRINDEFFVVGTGIDLDNFSLTIYDRWGEIIWQTDDIYEHWKAYAKGGDKKAQNGSYVWKVVYKDYKNVEHTKSGIITIIN